MKVLYQEMQCFLQMHPKNFIILKKNTSAWRLKNVLVDPGKLKTFTKGMAVGKKIKEQ